MVGPGPAFGKTNKVVATLRQEHQVHGLNEADLAADPLVQFEGWLREAMENGLPEPNAMTLATATPEGEPSARVVLLRGFDQRGFVFYTNYESRKGSELSANPRAALVFHWAQLARQVRVTGRVERVSQQESETYFNSRPRLSRLGAWASQQSRIIADRAILEERLRQVEAEFPGDETPLPPFWGGYRVVPDAVEFWQGRPNRLHDRLRYVATGDEKQPASWRIERLSP